MRAPDNINNPYLDYTQRRVALLRYIIFNCGASIDGSCICDSCTKNIKILKEMAVEGLIEGVDRYIITDKGREFYEREKALEAIAHNE
jgi:hypothetical protein